MIISYFPADLQERFPQIFYLTNLASQTYPSRNLSKGDYRNEKLLSRFIFQRDDSDLPGPCGSK
jgi:hypothetical protein